MHTATDCPIYVVFHNGHYLGTFQTATGAKEAAQRRHAEHSPGEVTWEATDAVQNRWWMWEGDSWTNYEVREDKLR